MPVRCRDPSNEVKSIWPAVETERPGDRRWSSDWGCSDELRNKLLVRHRRAPHLVEWSTRCLWRRTRWSIIIDRGRSAHLWKNRKVFLHWNRTEIERRQSNRIHRRPTKIYENDFFSNERNDEVRLPRFHDFLDIRQFDTSNRWSWGGRGNRWILKTWLSKDAWLLQRNVRWRIQQIGPNENRVRWNVRLHFGRNSSEIDRASLTDHSMRKNRRSNVSRSRVPTKRNRSVSSALDSSLSVSPVPRRIEQIGCRSSIILGHRSLISNRFPNRSFAKKFDRNSPLNSLRSRKTIVRQRRGILQTDGGSSMMKESSERTGEQFFVWLKIFTSATEIVEAFSSRFCCSFELAKRSGSEATRFNSSFVFRFVFPMVVLTGSRKRSSNESNFVRRKYSSDFKNSSALEKSLHIQIDCSCWKSIWVFSSLSQSLLGSASMIDVNKYE